MRSLLAILLFTTAPAWGASRAGDLLAACDGAHGTTGDLLCDAYINGLANGIDADQIAEKTGMPICLPKDLTTAQVRGVIKTFLRNRPKSDLELPSAEAVTAVLLASYPCRKSK